MALKQQRRIEGTCAHCGIWRQGLHRDHILAVCRGGSDDPNNIQLLCANCHQDKTRVDLAGHKRQPLSPETKAKIGTANRGRRKSQEERLRMSRARTGISRGEYSESHRLAISEGRLRGSARRRQMMKEVAEMDVAALWPGISRMAAKASKET